MPLGTFGRKRGRKRGTVWSDPRANREKKGDVPLALLGRAIAVDPQEECPPNFSYTYAYKMGKNNANVTHKFKTWVTFTPVRAQTNRSKKGKVLLVSLENLPRLSLFNLLSCCNSFFADNLKRRP